MKNKTDTSIDLISTKAAEALIGGQVTISQIEGIDDQGRPLVKDLHDANRNMVALSAVPVSENKVGRQVIMTYADGNPDMPVILGLIHNPLMDIIESQNTETHKESDSEIMEIELEQAGDKKELLVDNKKIVINAEDEIVLRCGQSSITLTKAGKIFIRGKYLLNRSSGVNRIVGGSVQVN